MDAKLKLLIILIFFSLFAHAQGGWDLQTGVWISPTNRNIGVQKSLQVGDGTGTDSLVSIGAVIHNLGTNIFHATGQIDAGVTGSIKISNSISAFGAAAPGVAIKVEDATDTYVSGIFPFVGSTRVGSMWKDATDANFILVNNGGIELINYDISGAAVRSSLLIGVGEIKGEIVGNGGNKILSMFNNGANFSVESNGLNYLSGVYDDGVNDPFAELSIFDPSRDSGNGEDVASWQVIYPTDHPHALLQLLDVDADEVVQTTFHQHGELVIENDSAGFKFKSEGDFIIAKDTFEVIHYIDNDGGGTYMPDGNITFVPSDRTIWSRPYNPLSATSPGTLELTMDATGATYEMAQVSGNDDVTFNVDNLINEGYLIQEDKESDPSDPAEGRWVMWMSNGVGSGDDGDIMLKITAGGVTKTITLVDFSAF